MTRSDFLDRLRRALSAVAAHEVDEIHADYRSHVDEAIAARGAPDRRSRLHHRHEFFGGGRMNRHGVIEVALGRPQVQSDRKALQ